MRSPSRYQLYDLGKSSSRPADESQRFLLRSAGTLAKSIHLRYKGAPFASSEPFDHSGLHLFPLPSTFREDSVPFAGDDSCARARVCSSPDLHPCIAYHGIEGSIQRRPVHFQFDGNTHERLALPTVDAAQYGKLGDVYRRSGKRSIIDAAQNPGELLDRSASTRPGNHFCQ